MVNLEDKCSHNKLASIVPIGSWKNRTLAGYCVSCSREVIIDDHYFVVFNRAYKIFGRKNGKC